MRIRWLLVACGLILALAAGAEAAPMDLYEDVILGHGDVIYYFPLDDLNVDDVVGGLTGTPANIAGDADIFGRTDKAIYFSGSGSEVDYGANLTLADQGTVEAFVRVDAKTGGNAYFLSGRTGSSADRFYLQKTSSQDLAARFGGGSAATILPGSEYSEGEWRYVAFTWEPSGSNYILRTYYADTDGKVQYRASTTGGGTPAASTPFVMGRFVGGGEQINGSLDSVVIYNSRLSHDALQSHYALATFSANNLLANYQQTVRNTPGVIHYWTMDNGSTEDIVGTMDHAHNVNTGTAAGPGLHPGSAIDLNGTDAYSSWDDTLLTLPATGTLELWVRPDSAPTDRGYALSARKIAGGTQNDRLYVVSWDQGSGGELRFGFGDNADAGQITDIEDRFGEWIYVALTWEDTGSGVDVRTYFSDETGLIQAGGTDLGNGGFAPQDALMRLGQYSGGGQLFDGAVDEVAFYSRVLSTSEMQVHYMAMVPEPASLTMLILGGALVGLVARRRRGALGWQRR